MFQPLTFQNFPEDLILTKNLCWNGSEYHAKYYCLSCSRNKRKCDRKLPSCLDCKKRGLKCTYRKEQKDILSTKQKDNSLVLKQRFLVIENESTKLNIYTNNKDLYIFMLQGSHIDDKSLKIFVRKDGKLDYFGYSPAGPMFLNYISLNQLRGRSKETYKFVNKNNVKFISERIIFKEEQLLKDSFMSVCIDHYFYYFCILIPVLDEKYIQDNPDPLLLKIIASIGYRYVNKDLFPKNKIKDLQNSILIELNQRFLKPSYTICICMSLILQFRMIKNGFKSIWLFLSISTVYPHLLGLNHMPPFKVSKRELRLRFNIWLAIFIQDKLKIFMVNRPPNLITSSWRVPYPPYLNLPKLNPNPIRDEFVMAREALSSSYFLCLSELTNLIGHSDAFQKKYIIEYPLEAEQRANKIIESSNKVMAKFHKELYSLCHNQPIWVNKLTPPLVAFSTIIKESICLNLIQNFLQKDDSPYDAIAITSCQSILDILKIQEHTFMISYSTYCFYSITLSCLILNYLIKRKKYKEKQLQVMFDLGIHILNKYRDFSPVVLEFLDQMLTLM